MGQVNIKPAAQVAEEARQAKKRAMTAAVQRHIDTAAQGLGYDSILSLASYAGSKSTRRGNQAKQAMDWRDDVWDHAETALADVEAGAREVPTEEELIAELPTVTWPA